MRKPFIGSLVGLGILSLSSCMKDECTRQITYTRMQPVYKKTSEFRKSISLQSARTPQSMGKIYLYNEYLLINEPNKGIHIYDIRVPESPRNVGFLEVLGCKDISVRNGVLFADSYMDVVAIDISRVESAVGLARAENVFTQNEWSSYPADPEKGIVVGLEPVEVTEKVACGGGVYTNWLGAGGGIRPVNEINGTFTAAAGGGSGSSNSGGRDGNRGNIQSLGGSMARFTMIDNYLYCVDMSQLHTFNVNNLSNFAPISQTNIGWNIETIFPYGDKLFVGSNTHMYIYDASTRSNPSYVSEFNHGNGCDPVFVYDNFAYVTLHSGTPCNTQVDELIVLDVSNLSQPVEIKSYPMDNPHGLSVKNNMLYLCEGDGGLKVFDIRDKSNIDQHLVTHQNGFNTYDVIASVNQNLLLVVGKNGLYLYDNSDPANLRRLSTITATP
jgi:hypothetical protein